MPSLPPGGGDVESWHYVRVSGTGDNHWKCVYPGRYDGGVDTNMPRNDVGPKKTWFAPLVAGSTAGAMPSIATKLGVADGQASYTSLFPPIQINNRDFAGPYSIVGPNNTNDPDNPWPNHNPGETARFNVFPFGGFMRVGDVMQVPYMGAYQVRELATPLNSSPNGFYDPKSGNDIAFLELNSLPMDCSFADDGITANDKYENIGRFSPLPPDDITGYTKVIYNPVNPSLAEDDWKGHTYDFAKKIFDYFTVIAPNEDFFPNINPDRNPDPNKGGTSAYRFREGLGSNPIFKNVLSTRNYPVVGTFPDEHAEVVKNIDTGSSTSEEETAGVHGLINVNTANWKVLSTVPFTYDSARNADIAKAIVNYREFGDLSVPLASRDPAVPFRSLFDLAKVKGTIGGSPGFRTFYEMHQFPPGDANSIPADPNDEHGDFSPFDYKVPPKLMDAVTTDEEFEKQHLLITRISNLLTTRSDSFTAYVIVQGWRNANTPQAELVVQRRAAMLIDRAGVTEKNREPRTMLIPVE
jgi:DNA uptake protein ComE-like DNA-binding protein